MITLQRLRIALLLTLLGGGVVYAQNPVSVFKLKTTDIAVNSGNKDNGTQRVVIATDQVQLTNALKVDGTGFSFPVTGTFWQATQPVSGTVTANMGTVTADPFGANADAASATGSISAKLRFIAGTGIPITGTVTVGSHAVTNAGTFVVQENGAALTSLQLIDDAVVADDAAFTAGTTKTIVAGFVADEGSTDSVNEDDAGAARMTLDRVIWAAPAAVTASSQAVTACNILSAASTNSTSCKGSAGNLYGFEVYNTSTTVYYLRLYNASSAPTCSSGTGFIRTIPIPPASAAGQVGGIVSNQSIPVNFATGIGYCITGGSSSTDNTNAATGVFGEIRYK